MNVHLSLFRALGIVTTVRELTRRRMKCRSVPTVLKNCYRRNNNCLQSGKGHEPTSCGEVMARTTREHPPAIAQPTRCASQWRLPWLQNCD